jgi:hypothetical protein
LSDETEDADQMRSIISDLLAPAREARKRAIAEHEARRGSPGFRNAIAYNRRICSDFIHLLHLVSMMATRSGSLSEHTLSIRMIDYFIQSTVVVAYLVENGLHGPAKRELRFLLEAGVKFFATDQALPGTSLKEKNAHLAELPDRFREIVDTLALPGLNEVAQAGMRSKILDLYGSLSTIVHASQAQVSVDLQRWTKGTPIGFETVAHANAMNALCLDVFDLGVVLSLHSIGLGLARDIYTAALDDMPKPDYPDHASGFGPANPRLLSLLSLASAMPIYRTDGTSRHQLGDNAGHEQVAANASDG